MKREKLLAFSKLLNRVKFQNNWNINTFAICAEKTDGVSKSEAIRFYKAIIDLGYLTKVGRGYRPAFDIRIWKDDDFRLNIIKGILENHPVVQKRGRIKGVAYAKPVTAIAVIPTNPLASISSKDMVAELRNRGFEVTCQKSITIIEEL